VTREPTLFSIRIHINEFDRSLSRPRTRDCISFLNAFNIRWHVSQHYSVSEFISMSLTEVYLEG